MSITTKEKLRGYFKDWEWLVTGYGWKFDVEYNKGFRDMPSTSGAETAMVTFANYKYLRAHIYVNLDNCDDGTKDEVLEEWVVHELVHLLLDPIDEDANEKLLEYTTTSIARLFLGARNSWKPNAKKK